MLVLSQTTYLDSGPAHPAVTSSTQALRLQVQQEAIRGMSIPLQQAQRRFQYSIQQTSASSLPSLSGQNYLPLEATFGLPPQKCNNVMPKVRYLILNFKY